MLSAYIEYRREVGNVYRVDWKRLRSNKGGTMKKNILTLGLASLMSVSMLAGCGDKQTVTPDASTSSAVEGKGSVYYLNFKPEADAQWQELASIYTEETGVPVTVVTAASGQYEATLKSEMAKSEVPTLFQVNGPVGLAAWKDYCYDLKGTAVDGELASKDFELMNGDQVAGIGYCMESYGLIFNKNLLEQAGYSQEDIKSLDDLVKVSEDITKRSDELGFSAFTSAGMDGSSDWRFKTHLANLPIYYEYVSEGVLDSDAIKGTYLDQYRKVWDMYVNNATCNPTQLSTKTGDDAVADFLMEKAVFYQNGTWAYNDVADIGDENLGYLPIYFGVEDDKEGLCTGTENYWCVNAKAEQDDIDATLAFMHWAVSSETGLKAMCGGEGAMPSGDAGMGLSLPFKGNLESNNLLVNLANSYVKEGKTPIAWTFTTMPSEEWKNGVGSALTTYAADQTDANWDKVVKAFVDGWKEEKAATAQEDTNAVEDSVEE